MCGCGNNWLRGWPGRRDEILTPQVQGRVWQRTDDVVVLAELDQIEASFWLANSGMQHHALLDARRIKGIADSHQHCTFADSGITLFGVGSATAITLLPPSRCGNTASRTNSLQSFSV